MGRPTPRSSSPATSTKPSARALAERHFGSWTNSASAPKGEVSLPPAPQPPASHLVLVDTPGSPQTALSAIGIGVPRSTPDLEAIQVMNFTLGGSFGSRINMNLRELHGYTYGAFSRFSLYREGGPFTAGGLIKTDVTAPATKELMSELNGILSRPPDASELKIAKEALVHSIPPSSKPPPQPPPR